MTDDEHAHVQTCPIRHRSVFNSPSSDRKSVIDSMFFDRSELGNLGPDSDRIRVNIYVEKQ